MRLIHEIPNIDGSVRFSNEADTGSTGTPASRCMEASFCDHAAEEGDLNGGKDTSMLFFQMQKWKS
jgi:hypothetical protein